MSLPAIPDTVRFTPTGLTLPEELSADEFDALLAALQASNQGLGWAIGDLWAFGEQHNYGNATDFANRLNISVSTLKTYGSVARAIAQDDRFPDLPFAHHQEVASLDADRRREILQQASDEGLSKAEVRRLAKGLPAAAPAPERSTSTAGQETGAEERQPADVHAGAGDTTWEERAVDYTKAAAAALAGALEALNRARITAPVAQAVAQQLNELDFHRDGILNALDYEVGGLLTLPKLVG